jgi:cytochrome c peroxidase
VLRGHALFTGAAGCSDCHAGTKFTNNKTVDVGKGLLLQVPSLVGVGYRGPFMHDGCAATLHDRFRPDCGGSQHGQTAALSGAQVDDLVAYLESI